MTSRFPARPAAPGESDQLAATVASAALGFAGRLGLAVLAVAAAAGGLRLGLTWATPTGQVNAIFPLAGIALASVLLRGYRVLPGLWLGTFGINLALAVNGPETVALQQAAPIAVGSATGYMLQAATGAWLVRRVIGFPNALATERAAALFVGLGGPLSCVIAPLVGVATLWWAGIMPGAAAVSSALVWWTGDCVGVFIFAPLLFVFFADPPTLWRRRLLVVVPQVFLLGPVIALFQGANAWERQRLDDAFINRTQELSAAMVRTLDGYRQALMMAGGFYEATRQIDRDEFGRFGLWVASTYPGLQSVEWVPRVLGAERDNYELAARQGGQSGFYFTERGINGEVVIAGARDDYFPVYFAAPDDGNPVGLGLDLGGDPAQRAVLERARDRGQIAVSGRLPDPRGGDHRGAMIRLFQPLYRSLLVPATVAERRAYLVGFAVVSLRMEDVVQAAVPGMAASGMALRIEDMAAPPGERELYETPGHQRGASQWQTASFSYRGYGHDWTLHWSARREPLLGGNPWQMLALFYGAFSFSGLTAVMLAATGGHAQAEHLVATRTAELVARNAEIQRFYHTVAHELKTPLAAAREFVAIVRDGVAGPVGAEQGEYLDIARDSCDHMTRLINDLLDCARLETDRFVIDQKMVAIGELAEQAVAKFGLQARHQGIQLRQVIPLGLPRVYVDRQRIAQVFGNLLDNAIKFTATGGQILIRASQDPRWPQHLLIAVEDTGRGIAAEQYEAIFERLYQVEAGDLATAGGLGLGLSLCRGIVQQHGGEIWVESKLGAGSTFFFTLPTHPDVVAVVQRSGDLGVGA